MDKTETKWFVMRAYKCESKAEEVLSAEGGLEYFLPKKPVIRTYHGRKSKRLVPAIPSLLFVHGSLEMIHQFKRINNFIQFVIWKKSDGQEYLTVPDSQMDSFIKVASSYEDVLFSAPEDIDIRKGSRVRIHGGRFDMAEGIFLQVRGKRNRRLVVLLDGIIAASVEVHPDLVEVM